MTDKWGGIYKKGTLRKIKFVAALRGCASKRGFRRKREKRGYEEKVDSKGIYKTRSLRKEGKKTVVFQEEGRSI